MERFGIKAEVKNMPSLDRGFIPLNKWNREFLKVADKPVGIAVERSAGEVSVYRTKISSSENMLEANAYYIDRIIKSLLWIKGGFRVYISGDKSLYIKIAEAYSPFGSRGFDNAFMSKVYERPFEVVFCEELPQEMENPRAIGRHLDGCRIGFDAGGSDRKVSAVIDGKTVFSEEVVWYPKDAEDPDYHFNGIVEAFRSAADKMPRVDAIGVSSAGIYINNRTMVASLFLKVPEDEFDKKVKDIYIRAAKEFGEVPFIVCNDGDVSALAGAMSLGDNSVLGIAMGTSEAVGFVDGQGRITGWLNELAFMPVDANPEAMQDEWSGDIGVGCKYFSQDAVIKLAPAAGIELDPGDPPAKKLKAVQLLIEKGDPRAEEIYRSIGVYLAHALSFYYEFYFFRHVLLLGRVMSGKGGDIILKTAESVLADEYPELSEKFALSLPNEKFRRVGQSMAAASLPEIKSAN